jgi:hypothetical protein
MLHTLSAKKRGSSAAEKSSKTNQQLRQSRAQHNMSGKKKGDEV